MIAGQDDSTVFSVPARWAIRVLACMAFLIAAYLAWHAATGSDVPGCTVGSGAGCDAVLSSKWSKWLSVPVSIAGLGCYAALAGFSILIGLTGPRESRWIDTLVVMLSTLAAGASIWFLALQVFAIRHFCPYCIAVDSMGIALGALALWSLLRSPATVVATHQSNSSMTTLRPTIPGAVSVAPLYKPPASSRPSIVVALGAAGALLVVLIGGQILLPAQTYRLETVALDQPIDMTGASRDDSGLVSNVSPNAQTHVAMRIPTDDSSAADTDKPDSDSSDAFGSLGDAAETGDEIDQSPADRSPKRERIVEFLGGQLKLDTYQHPILGDPEAPHIVVELISYDCPHCRKMHPIMQRAQRRYGDQVAILVLPIPFEMKCNRLIKDPRLSHVGACTTARMALAVARLKPAKFRSFHDDLMEDEENPPTQAHSVAKAYSMVDSSKLSNLTRGKELSKQIAQYINLYDRLRTQNSAKKSFGLPIQILGDNVMSGSVEKADEVYDAWEKNLGVKPR